MRCLLLFYDYLFIISSLEHITLRPKNNYKNMSITQNKSKPINSNPHLRPSASPSTSSPRLYFYTNALFMGTTKSLQRIGTGLILFHDNTCAIVSYNQNSQLHGRSIFYRQRCLISTIFTRNRLVQVVYRVDGYMLYLKYNQLSKIHGNCYVFQFVNREIYEIRYQQGYTKSKVKLTKFDKVSAQSIFANRAYHLVIGKSHARVIGHQITSQEVQRIKMVKLGNKVQVHYLIDGGSAMSNKLTNGLGFQFMYRTIQSAGYNSQTNQHQDQFQLKLVQKGLYENSMLQGYGYRLFKNNNIYQGLFKNNQFHGEGCLKNIQKNTWVYGDFINGQMKDIIDFCNEGNQIGKCMVLMQNLRNQQDNFIKQMVEQNNFYFLDVQLERITSRGQIEQIRNQTFQDRKQQLMRKITAQFTQTENLSNNKNIKEQLISLRNSQITNANININLKQNNKNSSLSPNNFNKKTNKIIPQTQRKQPYSIKSLLPQSIKITNFEYRDNASPQNSKQLQNLNMDRQQFNKRVATMKQSLASAKKDPNKKYSKIFHKTYSHLQAQQQQQQQQRTHPYNYQRYNYTSPRRQHKTQTQFIKLHQIQPSNTNNNYENFENTNNRMRKSYIFSTKKYQNNTQLRLPNNNNLSPSVSPDRIHSLSPSELNNPFQRRSTQRKTAIFQSTTKLKKVNPMSRILDTTKNNDDDLLSPKRLESIRKGSIEKKNTSKSNKSRKNHGSPIFEQGKQKNFTGSTKFVYTYEDKNVSQKQPTASEKKLLKSQSLTKSLKKT